MAATAPITGVDGTVTIGAPYSATLQANLYEWTIEYVRDVYNATKFGAVLNGHEHAVGMYEARGHCRGYMDGSTDLASGSINPERVYADITLVGNNLTTDQSVALRAHCTNFQIRVNKHSGLNELEFDFVGTTGTYTASTDNMVVTNGVT